MPSTAKAEALSNLVEQGLAQHRAGALLEARAFYKRVLQRDARHFDGLHLMAMTFAQEGQFELALPLVKRALSSKPDVAAARALEGAILHGLKRSEEALASFDRALRLDNANPDVHANRGSVLNDVGRHEEAIDNFDAALALAPDLAGVHYNRGVALAHLGRPLDAVRCYDTALRLAPQHQDAILNRSFARLQMGDFASGWSDFEARLTKWYIAHHQYPAQSRWTGQPLAGKRLFLHYEQGLGDTLQFARYAPFLARDGAQVFLSVQAPLVELLRRTMPDVTILGEREAPEAFDYHCPLMSLPLVLGARLGTIPAQAMPLRPDPALVAQMSALLGRRTKLRVGLSWSGSTTHANDHNRSIPFATLRGFVEALDVDWIALQNEVRPSDQEALQACGRVRFFGEHLKTFDDTAALAELVDLTVTVDTSIAHLAGAMAKPVCVLLPYNPDWRWMLGRSDSPWYATARLFRQPAPRDWPSVLTALGDHIGLLRSQRRMRL